MPEGPKASPFPPAEPLPARKHGHAGTIRTLRRRIAGAYHLRHGRSREVPVVYDDHQAAHRRTLPNAEATGGSRHCREIAEML